MAAKSTNVEDDASQNWHLVHASCMCKQLQVSLEIPQSSLPIPICLCHCNTCRYANGQLAHTVALLHQAPQRNVVVTGNSVQFLSGNQASLERHFCGTCGTTVHGNRKGSTTIGGIASGSVDIDPAFLEIKGHIYVGDTRDGGIVPWLSGTVWAGEEDGETYPLVQIPEPEQAQVSFDEFLHCSCRCGGVQFQISRPNSSSTAFWAPFCEPFAVVRGCSTTENPADEKYWVSKDGKRYLACVCTCHSCRKASGMELPSWAFVPKVNILAMDGGAYTFKEGTLTTYESSPGVSRDFCGRCGATCFFRWVKKAELIDVSPALMRSRSGVRAEDWLFWSTSRISYPQDARYPELAAKVQNGIKDWAIATNRDVLP